MLRSLLIIFCLFIFHASFAQKDYARTILDTLCSERYEGRGYVNNGDNKAAEFIIRELKQIGVQSFKKHEFSQPYQLNVNTFPYPISVVLDKDTLRPGIDYLVDSNSGSAQGDFELIEINSENYASHYRGKVDLSIEATAQKIFAFNFTDVLDKKKRLEFKKMAYQAMHYFPIIWVEKDKQNYSIGRQHANYPLISIDSASYRQVKTVSIQINNAYKPKYDTQNVIGLIPGKKKRKYVVLSAHFDHLGKMGDKAMFPGANDNASGVAMLLSIAKYFIKNPPHYSIVFCFFSGEEAGLEGSKHFVNHPYMNLKQVKFVLNIDIMGGAEKGIALSDAKKEKEAFNVFKTINAEKNYLELIKSRGHSPNSDHYFFSELNIPAFFIYSIGSVKNYHDINDTPENTTLSNFDEVQHLILDFISTLKRK